MLPACALHSRPDPAVAGVIQLPTHGQILGSYLREVIAGKPRELQERLQLIGDERFEVGGHGLVYVAQSSSVLMLVFVLMFALVIVVPSPRAQFIQPSRVEPQDVPLGLLI